MNVLADEGVERQIVERLRADGHIVLYVAELEPGISDEIVLEAAVSSNAILLTQDKDFGELVFRKGLVAHGVVLLRLAGSSHERKSDLCAQLFSRAPDDFVGKFCVITERSIRFRTMLG